MIYIVDAGEKSFLDIFIMIIMTLKYYQPSYSDVGEKCLLTEGDKYDLDVLRRLE